MPGGGTVAYVNPAEHLYLADIERREEGGTPAIVESIRAGLVFGLKEAVGVEAIREREESFIHRAIARWSANPNVEILGNPRAERLSIVSFVVRHRQGGRPARYLHHNYVVALLNDLFGIQARGGCSCAGRTATGCWGSTWSTPMRSSARSLAAARGSSRAGSASTSTTSSARPSSPTSSTRSTWWRPTAGASCRSTGSTRSAGCGAHRGGAVEPPLSLGAIRYDDGVMRYAAHRHREPEARLPDYLAEARRSWPIRDPRPTGPGARWTWASTSSTSAGSGSRPRPRRSSRPRSGSRGVRAGRCGGGPRGGGHPPFDTPRTVRSRPKDGSPGTLRRPGAEPTVRSSRAPEVSEPAQSRAIHQRSASPAGIARRRRGPWSRTSSSRSGRPC